MFALFMICGWKYEKSIVWITVWIMVHVFPIASMQRPQKHTNYKITKRDVEKKHQIKVHFQRPRAETVLRNRNSDLNL